MYKVGDRVWHKHLNEFCLIHKVVEESKGYYVYDNEHSPFARFDKEDNLHQTADSMFKELGYEDKSHTTKGWFLIEKDFESYIEEIRIDILTSDYKKSRIFPEDKKMWSGTITMQEHLAIHQKLIELGWIKMKDYYNTTAVNVGQPCVHDVRVDTQNGQFITYCAKCGAILDTKPVFRSY